MALPALSLGALFGEQVVQGRYGLKRVVLIEQLVVPLAVFGVFEDGLEDLEGAGGIETDQTDLRLVTEGEEHQDLIGHLDHVKV